MNSRADVEHPEQAASLVALRPHPAELHADTRDGKPARPDQRAASWVVSSVHVWSASTYCVSGAGGVAGAGKPPRAGVPLVEGLGGFALA